MTDEEQAWPKQVRHDVESARSIGLNPVVTGQPGGDWTVAVEGEHVRATAAFAYRNGKTKRVPGELTVDGEPYPLAESWHELREFWNEHELGLAKPAAALLPVTDPGDLPVPGIVRTTAEMIEARAGGIPVRTGTGDDGHWLIAVDGKPGDGLRLVFTRHGRSWGLEGIQVVVDGADRSAEAEGDISKALALAFGGSHPDGASPGTSPVRGQPGYRDNGIETRTRVVIRELARDKENKSMKLLRRTGLTWYWIWYLMAAANAGQAVYDIMTRDWLWVPFDIAVALVIGMTAAKSHVLRYRDGTLRLRAELSALLAARAVRGGSVWLNRDEHLAFNAYVHGRLIFRHRGLLQVDEDIARDIDAAASAGGGRVAVTSVGYMVVSPYPRVMRVVDGGRLLVTEDDVELEDEPKRFAALRLIPVALRELARQRVYADVADLEQVIPLFRAAERIESDDTDLHLTRT